VGPHWQRSAVRTGYDATHLEHADAMHALQQTAHVARRLQLSCLSTSALHRRT